MKIKINGLTITLKKQLDDFVVQEVVDFKPSDTGDFGVYLLKKWGATTWDVLMDIQRRLGRKKKDISYVGIKDKHGITTQHITIKHGPKKDLRGKNYSLKYLGLSEVPINRYNLLGNRFFIRVRASKEIPQSIILDEVEFVKNRGYPNYYDKQRFVSVNSQHNFFAKYLVKKQYKKAIFVLLTDSSLVEAQKSYQFRECVKKNWPNIIDCINLAPTKWEKNILILLASQKKKSNTLFKKALSLIDKDYLFFLCNVYQSYIWNQVVENLLETLNIKLIRLIDESFEYGFYTEIHDDHLKRILGLELPLPGPKILLKDDMHKLYNHVLQKEGIRDIACFRTRIKGAVFKSNPRPVLVIPDIFKAERIRPTIWEFEFFLPKGSYGTLFIKRVFLRGRE